LSDEDILEADGKVDVAEEMKRLRASYTQCTQHGDLYKR